MLTKIYCVRCKEKVEVNAEETTFKNGRLALKSVCPKCGTKVFCLKKKDENRTQ